MLTRSNLAAVITGILASPGAIIVNSLAHIRSGSVTAMAVAAVVGIVAAVISIKLIAKDKTVNIDKSSG